MAVSNVQVTCEGYSGDAAGFVTQVQFVVNGEVVATENHAAGDAWSFAGSFDIEGSATVQVFDRTAGNDYDAANGGTEHGGAASYLHTTYQLDCPVSTSEPEATLPVPVSVVEPTVPQSPDTTVELSTVSPSTTNYSGMDEFRWSSPTTTVWGPCFEDGSCLPPPSTVMEATTVQPVLAVTGANYVPQFLGAGAALVLCGLVLRRNARPRKVRA